MSGQTLKVNWGRFTDISGDIGMVPMAAQQTRLHESLNQSGNIRIRDVMW